jgi:hypothetical protein
MGVGSIPTFGIVSRASKRSAEAHNLGAPGALPGPATNFWGVRQAVKPSVFQAENHGFESRTPYLRPWVCGLTGEGNGLLSRAMWVRLPPDPSVVCFHSSIGESGAGITCQHQIGARSGFESRWEHLIRSCSSIGRAAGLYPVSAGRARDPGSNPGGSIENTIGRKAIGNRGKEGSSFENSLLRLPSPFWRV